MDKKEQDIGVLVVIAERFYNSRMPRAQQIRARLEQGELLADHELEFLHMVLEDSQNMGPLLAQHPEIAETCARIAHYYKEILDLALANEQRANQTPG